jgi:hypothetical protein
MPDVKEKFKGLKVQEEKNKKIKKRIRDNK